jgi:indole-3-glycerol phosphate synthase
VSNTLSRIIAETRERVAQLKSLADRGALEDAARAHQPRGFRRALEAAAARGPAVIAELKKASPSRGLIREDFDVARLAPEYAHGGATALSVLTEEKNFQGSLDNLRIASATSKLPCLRKDFIVDELQIVEARANAADAILLIAAALSDSELERLRDAARKWQLDVLCEVHDEAELDRAIELGFSMLGVNSRNLKTLEVSLETAVRLARRLPRQALRVAESGIYSGDDVAQLRRAGYQAFLIGESLMREPSPGAALRRLLQDAKDAEAAGPAARAMRGENA